MLWGSREDETVLYERDAMTEPSRKRVEEIRQQIKTVLSDSQWG